MASVIEQGSTFSVGGLNYPRPFKIRRLGHSGVDLEDVERGLKFYSGLLGFQVSDIIDFNRGDKALEARVGSGVGYFMRHGTDHHSFVLFPLRARRAMPMRKDWPSDVTVNQITWQVGSLREVVEGNRWFLERGERVTRQGRDTPGSNWHSYPIGPGFNVNELYYGIEQVGWDGLSKPTAMHTIHYDKPPMLPHISELEEVEKALAAGIDIRTGWRHRDEGPEMYDVGGVLLPRPFKIVKIGPIRIFEDDVAKALLFYRDTLGLTVTEEIVWNGHRCVFLRCNTEHHSIALYPKALRAELGLSPHTSLMAFGFQVAEYSQLRAAVKFLKEKGVTIKTLPAELFPGMGHSALAIDPEGHAMQLYDYMEQIGWDGKPRPASLRPKIDNERMPETLDPQSDSYHGEVFLGPLG
jgi:catechol 2,3-dioxygenase-like lactoylglutathione lyase family enzyme